MVHGPCPNWGVQYNTIQIVLSTPHGGFSETNINSTGNQKMYIYIYIYIFRHECFTGKYTTRKIHKNYIRDPSSLFSIISHVSLLMTQFRSFPSIILTMSFCLYNKKNITSRLEDMNFIFEWQKQNFTHSLRSFIKYCFATRK